MTPLGYFLYEWVDETSQFDPLRIWNPGCECWERSYSCWLPEEARAWDIRQIEAYIENTEEKGEV